MVVPWDELPSTTSPFAFAFGRFGLPAADQVMNAVVLTAALSVLNSGLYSGSRMLFALSKHGYAPRWVEDRNRNGVPWKAILLSTVVGYVAIAANYAAPKVIFDFIMNSAGLVAMFVYAFVALTQWRLRNRMSTAERDSLKLKMWLHPWLDIVVLAVGSHRGPHGHQSGQRTPGLAEPQRACGAAGHLPVRTTAVGGPRLARTPSDHSVR